MVQQKSTCTSISNVQTISNMMESRIIPRIGDIVNIEQDNDPCPVCNDGKVVYNGFICTCGKHGFDYDVDKYAWVRISDQPKNASHEGIRI